MENTVIEERIKQLYNAREAHHQAWLDLAEVLVPKEFCDWVLACSIPGERYDIKYFILRAAMRDLGWEWPFEGKIKR